MEAEIRFRSSTVAEECVACEAAVTLPRWFFGTEPKLGWLGRGSTSSGLFGSVRDAVTGYRGCRSAIGEAGSSP